MVSLFEVYMRLYLLSTVVKQSYLTVFSINGVSMIFLYKYINMEPTLNSISIKLRRVFLSYNTITVSSHYLIFYQHVYTRQLSNRFIFHAGRYLDDKEISYLRTVIVTANVCRSIFWISLKILVTYRL